VVILTAPAERDIAWSAEVLGATSFLDKDTPLDELVATLRAAALACRAAA
jgi:DNA-binding NarL/FixJ family response regulator